MPGNLLQRLEEWKGRFGGTETGELERLLERAAGSRVRDTGELIRLHETLLFLRAYPRTERVARLADEILAGFADRVGGVDSTAFEDPEVSGIAGTSLGAVFSYEVARSLARRHGRAVDIAWDRYDDADRMGPVAARLVPLSREDWPVEAHVPFQRWIAAAHPKRVSDLAWVLARLQGPDAAERYGAMSVPLAWNVAPRVSRSRMRLPARKLFCHREPLLKRSDVSLARELEGPPIPVKRVERSAARRILDLIMDTSAMRYRELYGFSHPEEARVFHADAGRGVEIYFFGVPPEWRLPLRAYHAGMFFKNGVPAGYVELLSLFERAEVGFNLYYTFREGESAWLYARLLRLFHQELGVTCFSVDPYQIGDENREAIDSGAFWFYRKMGFRPTDPAIAELTAREERRMQQTPGYRSSRRTLERLATGYMIYEGPGAEPGAWDGFTVRNAGLRMTERGALPGMAKIAAAKRRGSEAQYLRMLQRDDRLRAEFLKVASGSGHGRVRSLGPSRG
jgi:hypothetical protein